MKVLITGAAGNLGNLLAKHMVNEPGVLLNLMTHKKEVAVDFKKRNNVAIFKSDLSKRETLYEPTKNVDVIVHFAGILFQANPEKFLPITNTVYFQNLLDVAIENKVKRVILISFPHVEGESTIDNPAKGHLNGKPSSAHARTRGDEERYLFAQQEKHQFEAVSLRVGMVYGDGILMIDTARWFAKHGILGIWKKPTWIQLISKIDFQFATSNAATLPNINGIYHLGDEGNQTLQEFLDTTTKYWGCRKPVRMPLWIIMFVAKTFEISSLLFGTRSPLTKDFIRIGLVNYYGDTTRMRNELLEDLKYKTFKEGKDTF
ncbi:MAG: NAD(P)-dependent oxidoreductase [Bacteroidetes bacterium]|nr:NAD(P)-dependent oxidoreductase [Bacteroidota bacterium]